MYPEQPEVQGLHIVRLTGSHSPYNTSYTPLAANDTFLGRFENISNYAYVTLTIFSDVDSAVGGLKFQWSGDGHNVDREEVTLLRGGRGRAFSLTSRAPYLRIVYQNGALSQTVFRLAVVYHPSGTGLISRPLRETLDDENFAQTTRAVLTAKKDDGTYCSLQCTDDGRLLVKMDNTP